MKCTVCKKPALPGRRTCSDECLAIRKKQIKDRFRFRFTDFSKKTDGESVAKIRYEYDVADRQAEEREIASIVEDL